MVFRVFYRMRYKWPENASVGVHSMDRTIQENELENSDDQHQTTIKHC